MVLPSISFRNPVVHLDKNTIRFFNNYTEASVYTVNGRVTVRLRPGKFQQSLLAGFMAEELAGTSKENRIFKPGECNLVWKCGIKGAPSRWELHIAIEKKLKEVSLDNLSLNQVMGVDVGENNAAALSTGRIFKAGKMKDDRDKYLSSRARFQRNGSRSARQALRKASGREKRHVEQINDEISKSIIEDAAERNIRLIVLEDLTDIRKRIKAGQKVRARLHRWPFRELQQKNSGQSLSSGYRSDLRGSSLYVENLSALQCHRNTAQAPICLQELWLQSAQRPQCWSESATSGLSADNSGAGVNKPYVEPALAGDNKAFDFSRELFTLYNLCTAKAQLIFLQLLTNWNLVCIISISAFEADRIYRGVEQSGSSSGS